MSETSQTIDDVRRKLAVELAPITRELKAAEELAQTPTRRRYWRSMGELLRMPSFLQWAQHEFPQLDKELSLKENGHSRRRFLQLMGASMALAGLGVSGCRRPETKIVPYNNKPVNTVIGRGMYYASTFVLAGRATGILAETHEGRPTKIEGNPLHPNSRGGTDIFAQASLLDLYDPDRSRSYRSGRNYVTREQFTEFADRLASELKAAGGAGLAILTQQHNSPAIEMVLQQMAQSMPQARVYVYEPLSPDPARPQAVYDFSKAKVIVSLDADIFGIEDDGTKYRRQFIDGRRVDSEREMNQLYVIEPAISQTGAIADHRLALKASMVGAFAQALLAELRGQDAKANLPAKAQKWVTVLAKTLRQAGASAVVVAGERQGDFVHQVAHQINAQLGSLGKAVAYRQQTPAGSIRELADAIRSGAVKTLVIAHGNPAYDAPADLKFADLLKSVPQTIRLGLYDDETSQQCSWHVPAAHYLESWGDVRCSDGSICSIQPMIEPMFAGMTTLELLARITGFGKADPYELVRESARRMGVVSDEAFTNYIQEGVLKGQLQLTTDAKFQAAEPAIPASDEIEICFAPDPKLYDGRFANNAWLQECPDPITKLTWDNAAIISLPLAKRLGLETGDMVKIEIAGRSLDIPVFIMPGVADNSITLPLGYGRVKGGAIARGAGFDTYQLRTSESLGYAIGVKVSPLGQKYKLATTQEHWSFDLDRHMRNVADEQALERAIIREGSHEQFLKEPDFAKKMGEHAPIRLNVYTAPELTGANQWAMIVDLNACVGCNACVIACQAENNVPVVGKDEVIRGREMHWLRLDRYFVGENPEEVRTALQPMMCQHCENAPCEPVCPVNATVHSPEGLNEMVYNRCIGTRYCSNNCPYKVRRFNYFDWNKGTLREQPEALRDAQVEPVPTKGWSRPQVFQPPMQEMLAMAKNPNVSVRIRGVMEKCTYCVQRIEAAKIQARSATGQGAANGTDANGNAAVRVPEGAVVSACAQVCPTSAIQFGDISDTNSDFYRRWSAAKDGHPRSYEVLEHLNVRPRTHYMARIRNVNRELEEAAV